MKLRQALILGSLIASLNFAPAFATDRETISFGTKAPTAEEVETILFPEAQCESVKYQCMAVRPSGERAVGMEIRFATGSAELTPEAKVQLHELGKVLASRNEKLRPGELIVEGHTDARGSAELNKKLSEERARSVAKHLIISYGVDAKALKPVGRGEDQLRDAAQPDAEVNRRVELVRSAN